MKEEQVMEDLESILGQAIQNSLEYLKSHRELIVSEEVVETELELDFDLKIWIAHRITKEKLAIPLLENHLLEIPGVNECLRYMIRHHFHFPNVSLEVDRQTFLLLKEMQENSIKQTIWHLFIEVYIGHFGLNYDSSKCHEIFEAWKRMYLGKYSRAVIATLLNFELQDLNEIDFERFKIRRITSEEMLPLLRLGAYNGLTPAMHQGIQDGASGQLNPMFCVEFSEDYVLDLEKASDMESLTLEILTLLRIYKRNYVFAGAVVNYSKQTFFGLQSSLTVISRPQVHFTDPNKYRLAPKDVETVQRLARELSTLGIEHSSAIGLAARRLGYSYERYRLEDQIVDLIVALEALLSPGNEGELEYRISLRSAYLIGNGPRLRSEIFRVVKLAYNVRSRIVHGDSNVESQITRKKIEGIDNMHDLATRVQEYIGLVLRKVIGEAANIQVIKTSRADKALKVLISTVDNMIQSGTDIFSWDITGN